MENNKREWPPVRRPRRRGINIRPVAMALALVLLVGAVVGGTIAWFIDETPAKENIFTVGNIDIDLTETKTDFKMVPGCTIDKDPKVSVTDGSEDCWLFVKIDESANLDEFITYAVATGWTAGDGTSIPGNVWYRSVMADDTERVFSVLTGDEVTVKDTVTKKMMDALTDATRPTLTFTAYAVQYYETNDTPMDVAAAWALAKPATP